MGIREVVHPVNIKVVEGLRSHSAEHHSYESMAWLLQQFRVEVSLKAGSFPLAGPRLIVMNHPGALDTPVLLSLIRRDDLYMVGHYKLSALGDKVASRLLPVYPRSRVPRFLTGRTKPLYRHVPEGVDPEEGWAKNTETVLRATRVLEEGAAVLISPTADDYEKRSEWRHGIGYIIKGVRRPDTTVVMTRVLGSTRWDKLRFFNPYLFPLSRKPTSITVEVKAPVPLAEFLRPGWSAVQASLTVRDRYLEVFGSLL